MGACASFAWIPGSGNTDVSLIEFSVCNHTHLFADPYLINFVDQKLIC